MKKALLILSILTWVTNVHAQVQSSLKGNNIYANERMLTDSLKTAFLVDKEFAFIGLEDVLPDSSRDISFDTTSFMARGSIKYEMNELGHMVGDDYYYEKSGKIEIPELVTAYGHVLALLMRQYKGEKIFNNVLDFDSTLIKVGYLPMPIHNLFFARSKSNNFLIDVTWSCSQQRWFIVLNKITSDLSFCDLDNFVDYLDFLPVRIFFQHNKKMGEYASSDKPGKLREKRFGKKN